MQDPIQDPTDPLRDPELQPIEGVHGVITLGEPTKSYVRDERALTEKRTAEEWAAWGRDTFGSAVVGRYIDRLTASQRKLLRAALVHALGPGHNGQVDFRARATRYHLHGIGLEVMDESVTEEDMTGPLMVVFVYEDQG